MPSQRGKSLKELARQNGTVALLKLASETPMEVPAAVSEGKKAETEGTPEGSASAMRACCGGMWC